MYSKWVVCKMYWDQVHALDRSLESVHFHGGKVIYRGGMYIIFLLDHEMDTVSKTSSLIDYLQWKKVIYPKSYTYTPKYEIT